MPGTAAKVVISERQKEVLEEIVARRVASVRLVQSAQIVLLAYNIATTKRVDSL